MADAADAPKQRRRRIRRPRDPRPMRASELALLERIALHYDVRTEEIVGLSRVPRYARARHMFFWALREKGYSYPEIGSLLGRDHTTVMSGVSRVLKEDFSADRAAVRWFIDETGRIGRPQPLPPMEPPMDPTAPPMVPSPVEPCGRGVVLGGGDGLMEEL